MHVHRHRPVEDAGTGRAAAGEEGRGPVAVNAVLGSRFDAPFDETLHRLEHLGRVELVTIAAADLARRRLRVKGSFGTEYLIALPRSAALFNGAVLFCGEEGAAVVKVEEQPWLRLSPVSAADALELGYHAGNLHWKVRFDGSDLLVAQEGPASAYLARIGPLLAEGRVAVAGGGDER